MSNNTATKRYIEQLNNTVGSISDLVKGHPLYDHFDNTNATINFSRVSSYEVYPEQYNTDTKVFPKVVKRNQYMDNPIREEYYKNTSVLPCADGSIQYRFGISKNLII